MKALKLFLLIIYLILVNSQIFSEDCKKVYNFYNIPLDHDCCEDDMIICDNEGSIISWRILGHVINVQYDFNYYPGLPKIQTIEITEKGLTTIPRYLLNCPNLESLALNGNYIEYLPNNFFLQLNHLKGLYLGTNYLKDLPSFSNELNNLENLNLCRNKFSNLPEKIYNLPNLQRIYLNDNPDLTVSFNRSPSQKMIEECYLQNLNILCYEPGSCKKIYLIDQYNFITDEQAKAKFQSCSNINNINNNNNNNNIGNIPSYNNNTISNVNNINNTSNTRMNDNKNDTLSQTDTKPNSSTNSNSFDSSKIIITLLVIGLIITISLFMIYNKKNKSKSDVIIYEKHNINEIIPTINNDYNNNNNNNNNNINNNNINNNDSVNEPPPYSLY